MGHFFRASAVFLAVFLVLPTAPGCRKNDKGTYRLNVHFTGDSRIQAGAKVYLDGVEVGKVESVTGEERGTVVVAEMGVSAIIPSRIKPGIAATARDDGGLNLDSSRTVASDVPLPDGSSVEGSSAFSEAIRRYATWGTVAALGVCLGLLLLLLRLLRSAFRFGVLIAILAASGFCALAMVPVTSGLLEKYLYPSLETGLGELRHADEASPGDTASKPSGATEPATTSKPSAVGDTTAFHLPNPRWVGFAASWLACLLVFQFILRLFVPRHRRPVRRDTT